MATETLPVLSPEDITALLAEGRARGMYDDPIDTFAKSGEVYMIFSDLPVFKGKDPASVLNSVKGVIKKRVAATDPVYDGPRLSAVARKLANGSDKKSVLLINLDALDAANASGAAK
jgi:hypothetical protein